MVKAKATLDGQVFSIPVLNGYGFFQALFAVPNWGYWIKAFPGVHDNSDAILTTRETMGAQFYTFFPLTQAIKARIVSCVGSLPISADDSRLPTLKAPGGVLPDGTVTDWFIIDGPAEFRVRALSDRQKRLQHQMVVNDTALAEMIAENWRPETSVQVSRTVT